jgi:hypothetical protein
MSDIVERLRSDANEAYRNFYNDMRVGTSPNVLLEAADEIERLRHENTTMALQSNYVESRLRAEIERLRAALTKMSECGEHPCAFCFEMAQIAREALAASERK